MAQGLLRRIALALLPLAPAIWAGPLLPQGLQEVINRAAPGATVTVLPGEYVGPLRINRPITLIGEGWPVVDGGGEGHVLLVTAPATIRGLTLRNSGSDLDQEHAGIMVRADSVVVEGNRLEDILFGIYVKEGDHAVIRDNRISGKPRPLGVRGDGIRLWYSHNALVEENSVSRVRDVVVWFSDGLIFRQNTVTDSRYGLHYMYSRGSLVEGNVFRRNSLGAFIMYSEEITVARNEFAQAAGQTGMGLGLKDADELTVVGNLFVQNHVGVYLDNSPRSAHASNRFSGNLFAYNDLGIELLPSVRENAFRENIFTSNLRPVAVSGGGTARANQWQGNFWSDYTGFDRNGDGTGDTPFRLDRLSDDLLSRHPQLQVLMASPALTVIDLMARVFPLLAPEAILIDGEPAMSVPGEPPVVPGRRTAPRRAGERSGRGE